MTAIAYKAGILAADSAIWAGNTICGYQRKIAMRGSILIAGAGDPAVVEWFLSTHELTTAWTGDPLPLPKVTSQSFGGLIIHGDCVFSVNEHGLVTRLMAQAYHVLGRPLDFLTGAMAAGAAPEQAVKLAIEMTDGAGGEVHVERLFPDLPPTGDLETDVGKKWARP